MPATVAITAMAMPTNIPKSSGRGRSTWADAACRVSGTSRINAGDVTNASPLGGAAQAPPLENVQLADQFARSTTGDLTSAADDGALVYKELSLACEARQRHMPTDS